MSEESRESNLCREQWRRLLREGVTLPALQTFYARYKYLIMSRNLDSYGAIGALLAKADKDSLPATAQRMFDIMMAALAQPATRGGDANALFHISGYLKRQLLPEEKRALVAAIERYRRGEVEFEEPAALLRFYFRRFPNAYIEQQVFLYPQHVKCSSDSTLPASAPPLTPPTT